MNVCGRCGRNIESDVANCVQCEAEKTPRPSTEDGTPVPKTPLYAYFVASLGGNVAVFGPLLLIAVFFFQTFIEVRDSVIGPILMIGLLWFGYFVVGSFLGEKWPATSVWIWSALVISPIIIIGILIAPTNDRLFQIIAGVGNIVHILPLIVGAERGKKRFLQFNKATTTD